MIVRSLDDKSELDLLVSLSRKTAVSAQWIGGMLDYGDTRPEWCRMAFGADGELRAAHALHSWRPDGSPAQVALLGHRDAAAAEELLRHDLTHLAGDSLGAQIAVYDDGTPAVAELRAEQSQVLGRAGFRVTVSRVMLGRRAAAIPVPDRLSFRPARSEPVHQLRQLFRAVGDGSLDHEMRSLRASADADAEAASRLDRALGRDFRDDWFVVGVNGSGATVGYVQSALSGDRAILAEIGVAAPERGNGYVNDLLAYGTAVLSGFPAVVSTTDEANAPMRAAFARAGYAETGSRTDYEWDRPRLT
jgi:RimJ/RimL family protein N-acetyltransferase